MYQWRCSHWWYHQEHGYGSHEGLEIVLLSSLSRGWPLYIQFQFTWAHQGIHYIQTLNNWDFQLPEESWTNWRDPPTLLSPEMIATAFTLPISSHLPQTSYYFLSHSAYVCVYYFFPIPSNGRLNHIILLTFFTCFFTIFLQNFLLILRKISELFLEK